MRPRRRDAVDATLYAVRLLDGVAVDESPGDAIEQASEVTSSDVHLRRDQAYMTLRAASSPLKQMMLPL